jgi:hypothetical protein
LPNPLFVLDQNFPEPILREALQTWVLEVELQPLRDVEPRLAADHEDWQVIQGLSQLGAAALVTCDDAMLLNPRVVAVIEQTRFAVVTCRGAGDDPVLATGLLLTHLPWIGRRYKAGQPMVWRLRAREQRPEDLTTLKDNILRRSGARVENFRISPEALQEPLLP